MPADLNHRLRPHLGLLGKPRSEATGKNHSLHQSHSIEGNHGS